MSIAKILSSPRLEYSAFSDQHALSGVHDLVYHPGIIPPLSSSIPKKNLNVERKLGETEVSYFISVAAYPHVS